MSDLCGETMNYWPLVTIGMFLGNLFPQTTTTRGEWTRELDESPAVLATGVDYRRGSWDQLPGDDVAVSVHAIVVVLGVSVAAAVVADAVGKTGLDSHMLILCIRRETLTTGSAVVPVQRIPSSCSWIGSH